MRKFYLENDVGARMDLQSSDVFLWQPDGLGFSENREYAEAQYGFCVPSTNEYGQHNINGTLVFKKQNNDPYESYMAFVDWVQSAGALRLVYCPFGNRELYIDGYIDGLELAEKTMCGVLECPITFKGTSPYHDRNPYVYFLETEVNKRPMIFPFRFPFRFSKSSVGGMVSVEVKGHFSAAIEMYINGAFAAPVLTAKDNTGKIIGKLDLTGVAVETGEQIYFSSRPNATGVWKITAEGIEDIVNELDLQNNNFFTLPAGKIYTITLHGDNDPQQATQHILRLHQYYKG